MVKFYGKYSYKPNNENSLNELSFKDEHLEIFCNDENSFYYDENYVVTFYGELYLKTNNKAKELLNLYQKYKEDINNYINGAYTFLIYNRKTSEVFISRDFIGSKPLYYYNDNEQFVFSTKISEIVDTYNIRKEINLIALSQFFSLTYIPAPKTIYKNIYKLKAANYLKLNNKNIDINEFWKIDYKKENLISDYNQCKKKLRDTLFESVQNKIDTGGRIGALISGGIDSTIISGITSELYKDKLDTFTVSYYNKDYDESNKASIAALKFNTNHHLYLFKEEEFLENVDDLIDNLDEPYGDSSYVCEYIILKEAKKYVDVIFTGDGGDELFAGYEKYLIDYYLKKYNSIPSFFRKGIIEPIFNLLPDNSAFTRKFKKLCNNSTDDIFNQRKFMMLLGFKNYEINNLFINPLFSQNTLSLIDDAYNSIDFEDEITKAQWTDFKVVLEGDMMPKSEYSGRATDMIFRSPILDKSIVELSYIIPSEFKLKGNKLKYILKDTFSDFIPKELLYATKKGFGVPLLDWMRNEFKLELEKYINEDFIEEQGIFNYSFVKNIFNEHLTKKQNRLFELWAFYVFQRWYVRYIK